MILHFSCFQLSFLNHPHLSLHCSHSIPGSLASPFIYSSGSSYIPKPTPSIPASSGKGLDTSPDINYSVICAPETHVLTPLSDCSELEGVIHSSSTTAVHPESMAVGDIRFDSGRWQDSGLQTVEQKGIFVLQLAMGIIDVRG